MILISVIVPVYNVRNYVERCVQSVLTQNIQDLELILVDDGSTDGSGELCDLLAKKDSRIRVIHQENQGLGPARNSGLDIAKGKYVSFVDSDDWLENNTYSFLLECMEKNNCKISTCGRKIVDDYECIAEVYCKDESIVLKGKEVIEQYLLQKGMNMAAWDKLFERELFENVRFPGNYISEDIVPIYRVLKSVDRIVLTGRPLYNYYCRPGSLSRSAAFTHKRMGQLMYAREVMEDVKKNYPDLKYHADYYLYDALISTWRSIIRAKYYGEERGMVKDEIHALQWKMLINPFMHKRQRLYVIAIILRLERFVEKFI